MHVVLRLVEAFEIFLEEAVPFPDFLELYGVLDYRFDFIFVARDAFVFQEPLNICVGETYDSVNVKISESFLSRESLLSTTVQFESA